MTIEKRPDAIRDPTAPDAESTQQACAATGDRLVTLAEWREAQRRALRYLQEFGLADGEAAALTAAALRIGVRHHRASPSLSPVAAVMAALESELGQTLIGRAGFFSSNSDRVQLARWRAFASLGGLCHDTPTAAQQAGPPRSGRRIAVGEAPALPSSPLVRRCSLSPRPIQRNAPARLWRWWVRCLRKSVAVLRTCCCAAR
ncbi:MAG: hypothetical protein P8076_14325 [Gammaproteobacteria bacterium]